MNPFSLPPNAALLPTNTHEQESRYMGGADDLAGTGSASGAATEGDSRMSRGPWSCVVATAMAGEGEGRCWAAAAVAAGDGDGGASLAVCSEGQVGVPIPRLGRQDEGERSCRCWT